MPLTPYFYTQNHSYYMYALYVCLICMPILILIRSPSIFIFILIKPSSSYIDASSFNPPDVIISLLSIKIALVIFIALIFSFISSTHIDDSS